MTGFFAAAWLILGIGCVLIGVLAGPAVARTITPYAAGAFTCSTVWIAAAWVKDGQR